MKLEIIYQDNDYIAINKPSGLLVHRSPIDKHETRFVIQMLRNQIGQYVYPVHRLDKPTSGVLLFGLSQSAATEMQNRFASKNVSKTYVAIVRGYTPDTLLINHPVKSIKDKYDKNVDAAPKEAITQLTTLKQSEFDFVVDKKYTKSRYSLVKLQPATGRRHQLRYHMKHISHPIIGDAKYGKGLHNRFFKEQLNSSRLLLAACELSFTHPFTHEEIKISAKPTDDFMHTAENLGWQSILQPGLLV